MWLQCTGLCHPARNTSCLSVRVSTGSRGCCALLLLWDRGGPRTGHPGRCFVCSCDAQRHILASVCAIKSLTRGHLISFTGYINCTLRFIWHFHVCLLFRLLCSVPHFSWEQIPPLSLLILEKKKNHFYVICFLYFLFSTCGSCFAGPLLCKSPFTEEDLPVRDWQEVPGAGYETFETCELANQQVPVCSSGYAPSISS